MKQGIHPDYKKCTIKCVCGNATHSTQVNKRFLTLKVELKDLTKDTATKSSLCLSLRNFKNYISCLVMGYNFFVQN